jgi:hypothetical protein
MGNDFQNNQYDIFISKDAKIRSNQGNSSTGACNKFMGTTASSIHSENLPTAQAITYYHTSISNHTPINPTSNITLVGNVRNCMSFYHPCDNSTKTLIDSLEQYTTMQAQYDYLLAELPENPELLQEILVLSDAMRELSDHAISRILQDSILYLNALKAWYEVVRTPIAKYCLAETYFSERKYEQAETVLREIPPLFAFNETELKEHANYMQFYNFKKQLQLADRNWTELYESEIAQLQRIAEATQGRSASMAQGVLCFFYDICYEYEIETDNVLVRANNYSPMPKNVVPDTVWANNYSPIQIYPNPTQSEITVATNNPAVKIVQMEIFDLTNRKLHQQTVNQSYSTLKLNELENGIYILKVYLDN